MSFHRKIHLTLSVIVKSGFTMQQRRPVRRALLSVSDKAGIVEFAQHFPHAVWSCFHRWHRAPVSRERSAGNRSVRLHRFPGNDGWTRQNPASESPRRYSWPSRSDDAIMEQHDIAPIDMVVVNPTRSPRPSPAKAALWKMRLKISISAARPWCAPQPRTIKMWPSW